MKDAWGEAPSRNVQTNPGYVYSVAAVQVRAQLACFCCPFKEIWPDVNAKVPIFSSLPRFANLNVSKVIKITPS